MKNEEKFFIWNTPKRRDLGLFTDLTLFSDTLRLAKEKGAITGTQLKDELGHRLQKMRLVITQSDRVVEDVLRELRIFKWMMLQQAGKQTIRNSPHVITEYGEKALVLADSDPQAFHKLLILQMQDVYTIPGWFVARLWNINPTGQGEVILPSPLPDWKTTTRDWEDNAWTDDLEDQTIMSAHKVKQINPGAFPVTELDWLNSVRDRWKRLSDLLPHQRKNPDLLTYRPRRRLALAMREACIKLLFDNTPYHASNPDFPGNRSPLYHRTFMGWCPRLEALELIFYTDWHPLVNGRVIVPTSVFRTDTADSRFRRIENVTYKNSILWLHQPGWSDIRIKYLDTLIAAYQLISKLRGTLYASLLDVRDEVCRTLRISPELFDLHLQKALDELPSNEYPWSIAVETDVREDEIAGAGQLRRGVYLKNIPHTLIALARIT